MAASATVPAPVGSPLPARRPAVDRSGSGAPTPLPMHLAVVGKGGAGKSVVAGTLARLLARRGRRVLALDSDMMPGLALSLGIEQPDEPPLLGAVERPEGGRWRLRKGIGPVRAVQRYSLPAPDGVRLLTTGKTDVEGMAPIMGAVRGFYSVIHRIDEPQAFKDWTLIGDLPAGPRQVAFDWAPYAHTYLVVVEPTWKSVTTARRVIRLARSRREAKVMVVVNRVSDESDRARVEKMLGEPAVLTIPDDPAVREADRLGLAPLDHAPDAPAIRAIEKLADMLDREAGSE